MARTRLLILVLGALLPYLARLPGALTRDASWLTSYFGKDLSAFLFFSAWNAVGWGAVLLGTLGLRRPRSVWVVAAVGFLLPLVVHSSLDLASDAQAAIVLVFVPIYSLPLVLVGALLARWYDRRGTREDGVP